MARPQRDARRARLALGTEVGLGSCGAGGGAVLAHPQRPEQVGAAGQLVYPPVGDLTIPRAVHDLLAATALFLALLAAPGALVRTGPFFSKFL